ncbi:MAG TPA: hypothetical protein PK861_01560 [Thermomonas sp.]|nr:hypothetical protein [Thermomonas sp.]
MAFKLTVSDTVTVPVKGAIANAAGVFQPFSFELVCDRLPADELHQAATNGTVGEVMNRVVKGWNHVTQDDGAPVPFSPENLAAAFNVVGIVGLAFAAYLEACGAKGKEKN